MVGLGGVNDFSLWQLFLRADYVVKFVIILLLSSSIYSWGALPDIADRPVKAKTAHHHPPNHPHLEALPGHDSYVSP